MVVNDRSALVLYRPGIYYDCSVLIIHTHFFSKARLCVGLFQGGQLTILRVYLGETSNTVIAMLPPEKQKKSTIKYTNFFLAFAMSTLCDAMGPGTCTSIIHSAICNKHAVK